ncbi:MAG: hypothetical protein F6J98_35010 [Moorea sp. SIO4G2]|nr:hypothetical protein [Moorena sp. SIO4G2]
MRIRYCASVGSITPDRSNKDVGDFTPKVSIQPSAVSHQRMRYAHATRTAISD